VPSASVLSRTMFPSSETREGWVSEPLALTNQTARANIVCIRATAPVAACAACAFASLPMRRRVVDLTHQGNQYFCQAMLSRIDNGITAE
jgi:hypothetical protein